MLYYSMRLLRLIAAWIDLLLFSIFMYLASWLPRGLRDRWYPKLYQRWNWCFVRAVGVQLYVHQQNSQPLPDNYLVISNHPSAFEDIGIPAVFPVRALAKAEVAKWWFVGRIGVAAGTVFVDRSDKESRQLAAKVIENRLLAGDSIAIFPEGGCYGRRLKDQFHYGTFQMSLNTNTPIVPVFIHYEAQEVFEWGDQTLPQKIFQIMSTVNHRANFYIYDAIDPSEFQTKQELTDHVYKMYQGWQDKFLV